MQGDGDEAMKPFASDLRNIRSKTMNLEGLDPERIYQVIGEAVCHAFETKLMNEGNNYDDLLSTAVQKGVEIAFWNMMTNATDMPCSDFYESVKEGVRDAVLQGAKIDGSR